MGTHHHTHITSVSAFVDTQSITFKFLIIRICVYLDCKCNTMGTCCAHRHCEQKQNIIIASKSTD